MFIYIIIGILALIVIWVVIFYNRIVTLVNRAKEAWADIDVQLKRRYDLIPNLVESVKGTMKQEQAIFNALAEARTRYAGAKTVDEKSAAAGGVESAFARLLVVMENYPQLKSAENVQTLMVQIEGTENRVSVERGRFNDRVREFNVAVKRFPGNVLAGMFGFNERPYFEAASGAENAPPVSF